MTETINLKCGCIELHDNIEFYIPAVEKIHECKKHKDARLNHLKELMEKRKNGKLY